MRMVMVAAVAAAAVMGAIAPAGGQTPQLSGYAEYQRTRQTHQNSWGAGAQYQLQFGGEQSAVKLQPSVGVDYLKQEAGEQSSYSASFDAALLFSLGANVAPYVGGSVSSNWSSGGASSAGAKLGLAYILGAQLKLQAQSPYALIADVRPGYVRGEERSTTVHFGVNFTL